MNKIKWLTNAAFELTVNNKLITIDPSVRGMMFKGFDESVYKKPDYIIVSHLHWDHISEIRYLYDKYKPVIISGNSGREQLLDYLDGNHADVYPAIVNIELDFGVFKVKPLYAIHRNLGKKLNEPVSEEKLQQLKALDSKMPEIQKMGTLEMTNYLLTLENGYRILIWGGEFGILQENMLRDVKPDLALVQFSPTMPEKLMGIINAVKPKKIIPYHHDISLTVSQWMPLLENFKKQCPYEFIILNNGEEIAI